MPTLVADFAIVMIDYYGQWAPLSAALYADVVKNFSACIAAAILRLNGHVVSGY
jgi:hypothetical protein